MSDRPIAAEGLERSRPGMTAQTQKFETNLLGAFPALLLVLVLILTLHGVSAHVAFA